MTSRNKTNANATATNIGTTNEPVMAVRLALKRLDIKASTFFVAKKRHEWLRLACSTRVSEETGAEYAVVTVAAVERYERDRKVGGTNAHGGAKKFTLWLDDGAGELEIAERILSEHFGREIKIDRLYRAKKAGEAATEGQDDEGQDDGEGEGDEA